MESVINKLQKQKAPGPDGFTGEFSQTFREEFIPFLHNLIEGRSRRVLPNSYETSITIIPQTRQRHYKKRD